MSFRQQKHLETFLHITKYFPCITFKLGYKISWTSAPYLRSTCAVASSIINIRFFLRRPLARHTSCLCPTLKFDPDSANSVSMLPGRPSMASLSCTCGHKKNDNFLNKLFWSRQSSKTLEI